MSQEEKRAWIMLVVTIPAYAIYLFLILGRAATTPLTQVPYAATMLWTIGAAIVANIAIAIPVAIATRKEDCDRKDERDRAIYRYGEYIGQSFIIVGTVAALGMAMLRLDYFWIANTIYLGFVLSAILGSIAKVVAYHSAYQSW
jgi:hypothetical protein